MPGRDPTGSRPVRPLPRTSLRPGRAPRDHAKRWSQAWPLAEGRILGCPVRVANVAVPGARWVAAARITDSEDVSTRRRRGWLRRAFGRRSELPRRQPLLRCDPRTAKACSSGASLVVAASTRSIAAASLRWRYVANHSRILTVAILAPPVPAPGDSEPPVRLGRPRVARRFRDRRQPAGASGSSGRRCRGRCRSSEERTVAVSRSLGGPRGGSRPLLRARECDPPAGDASGRGPRGRRRGHARPAWGSR